MTAFVNEAYTDFSLPENAATMRNALAKVRSELGREYDLLVAGERRKSVVDAGAHPIRLPRCSAAALQLFSAAAFGIAGS